jgi:hypothetical protein
MQDPKLADVNQDTPLKTDIVDNIGVHQSAPPPTPVSEHENLDGLMQEVNHQLKREDVKPAKHHWFGHQTKDPNFSAQPAARMSTAPAAATHQPTPQPAQRQPHPAAHPTAKPTKPAAPAKVAKPKSSKPVMTVVFTVIITAFLIMMAISAYKK